MKIFVAYGYRPEDAWIEEMVFPIIRAFGSDVSTGADLFGKEIADGVKNRIREADALVGFMTRRDPMQPTGYSTHPWVLQETAIADALPRPILEIWETGVPPAGIGQNHQRITYDASARDTFLVKFVKAMGDWHSESVERPQLAPVEVGRLYLKHRNDPTFRCTYQIRRGDLEMQPVKADIYRAEQGVYVTLKNIQRRDLVSIQIYAGNEQWESPFTRVDNLFIQLEKI